MAQKKAGRGRFEKLHKWADKVRKNAQKRMKRNKWWKAFYLALWGIGLAAWVGIVLFASQWIVAFPFRFLPEDALESNLTQSIYQVIVYAFSMLVVIFVPWLVLKNKTTRDELGLRGLPTWADLLLAPIGFVVVMLLAGMMTAVFKALMPGVDWEQAQQVGYTNMYRSFEFGFAFICLVVLAPICEEIIFRGWLYGKLRVRMAALPAILIVSILFGIMHGQWNVGVTVFVMSVGMCLMRELTGTVWAGILLHMIKNGIAFYLLFVLGMG